MRALTWHGKHDVREGFQHELVGLKIQPAHGQGLALDQALELRSAGGRIVAYTRISAGEPDGALGEQRATIERYCNLYGLRVDEWIARTLAG